MQSAGPASPKRQHRPGKTRAAPRTTRPVGPVAARGRPAWGRAEEQGPAVLSSPSPASRVALRLVSPRPSPCLQALGPLWTRRLVWEEEVARAGLLGSDKIRGRARSPPSLLSFEFVGGKWRTLGVLSKNPSDPGWESLGASWTLEVLRLWASVLELCTFMFLLGHRSLLYLRRSNLTGTHPAFLF